jgi:hypothetical protein
MEEDCDELQDGALMKGCADDLALQTYLVLTFITAS